MEDGLIEYTHTEGGQTPQRGFIPARHEQQRWLPGGHQLPPHGQRPMSNGPRQLMTFNFLVNSSLPDTGGRGGDRGPVALLTERGQLRDRQAELLSS
jgi:hypothetical protein